MLPREFLGMARELHSALEADDIVAYDEVGRIRATIGVMISNNQQIRPAMFERTAAAWRDRIPTTGRLRLEINLKPKSLSIRELRIVASDSRFTEWEPDRTEPGIGL